MNFLMRNLGWVFLFIFFFFMLFIIINNEENGEQSTNGDQSLSESDTSDIVDELIERLENETVENDDIDTLLDSELQDLEAIEPVDTDERGFFSRLFGRSNVQDSEIDEEDDNLIVNNNEFCPQESSDEAGITVQDDAGEYIQSSVSDDITYATIVKQMNKVEIGQRFRVATHSLRLNNKYFNETLGFLMQGDELISLSESNSFGCFLAEVTHSDTAGGKQGFVCQRFLSTIGEESLNDYIIQIEDEEVFPEVLLSTQIGDIITISQFQVDMDSDALFLGDQIEQISEIDEAGCFVGRVHFIQDGGYISLLGRVEHFCAHEIVR